MQNKYISHQEPLAVFRRTKLCLAISALLCPPLVLAAPQGGKVINGFAAITQSGSETRIDQSSQRAVINWQGFSIAPTETVNFKQPDASALTLNRVVGNERSVIEGALNANGKIFLINSNGLLFTKGSSVNTAGLVASTLDISNGNFESGNYVFRDRGGNGSLINLGTLTTTGGGYVALLSRSVRNEGEIHAPKGTVALGSGAKISLNLNFSGDSLLNLSIDEGALNALIDNKGGIYADGGRVILSAKAVDDLLASQVNHSGIVQARTLDDLKGAITINAGGGSAHIAGTLDASAPADGDGGTITTRGSKVEVADGAVVTTLAAGSGKTGNWLLESNGFNASATGGNISGATLGTALGSSNVAIVSGGADIQVNDAVKWAADNSLALTAGGDIHINAGIQASGEKAGLAMRYGGDYHIRTRASYSGTVLNAKGKPVAKQDTSGGVYGSVTLSGADASLKINDDSYTLIHDLDQWATTGTRSGNYALAQDLDATAWSGANAGKASVAAMFSGTLAGLGHTIGHLSLRSVSGDDGGLIGRIVSGPISPISPISTIRDIGMTDLDLSVASYSGALVGSVRSGGVNVSGSYASGKISKSGGSGGLIGYANSVVGGEIRDSYASVDIEGTGNMNGGLIGWARNINILHSHATGNVSGANMIGGLVGKALSSSAASPSASVSQSYATGRVVATEFQVGGLVGAMDFVLTGKAPSVRDSFATGDVSASHTVGGLVGLVGVVSGASNKIIDIDNSWASGKVSASYNGLQINGKVGGLIGEAWNARISDSHAYGDVAITGTGIGGSFNYAGGLVGFQSGGYIRDSSASGNVTGGERANSLGGLVGNMQFGDITNSQASGNVSSFGDNIGGLVGIFTGGDITGSTASGSVTGNVTVGGLVGILADGRVADSSAKGNVTVVARADGEPGRLAGGLVGMSWGDIVNSTATGSITGGDGPAGLTGWQGESGSVDSRSSYHDAAAEARAAAEAAARAAAEAAARATAEAAARAAAEAAAKADAAAQAAADAAARAVADAAARAAADTAARAATEAAAQAAQAAEQAAQMGRAQAAAAQGGSLMAGAQRDRAEPQQPLQLMAALAGRPSIESNLVVVEPRSYSAEIRQIEVDGVLYDVNDDADRKP